MPKGKYNVKPREMVCYACVICEAPKVVPRCDFEKRARENNGNKPDTCSRECRDEKMRRRAAMKRGEMSAPEARAS